MKILAPFNNYQELKDLISAGGDEFYAGIISRDWQKRYTNIGSPNRREWSSANLSSFKELQKAVNLIHKNNRKIWITLNAFYTPFQKELLMKEIDKILDTKVDGFIVADLGIISMLSQRKIKFIISTCATVFNCWGVKFYNRFSPERIALPRQLNLKEITKIVREFPGIKFEVFVLNSGCKNIDGFCTFHHGLSELRYPGIWNFFKKRNLDIKLLDRMRTSPRLLNLIKRFLPGIDSACLLDYKIEIKYDNAVNLNFRKLKNNLNEYFSLYTGIDPCRACEIINLQRLNIEALKIVGRNYNREKKIKDVRFIKKVIELCFKLDEDRLEAEVKKMFKKIYGFSCGEVCYHR